MNTLLLFPFAAITIVIIALPLLLRHPKRLLTAFILYLLLQFLVISWFGKQSVIGTAINRLEEFFILFSFVVLAGSAMLFGKFRRTFADIPLVLLIILGLAGSFVFRYIPVLHAFYDLLLFLKGFMLFYLFVLADFTPADVQRLVRIMLTISLVILVLGFFDLASPDGFRALLNNTENPVDYRFGLPSVQSIFVHPGDYGWFMIFIACFCLAFFLVYRTNGLGFLVILFVLGAFTSMRFKPAMGMLFSVLTALIILPRKYKGRLVSIIFFSLFFIVPLFGGRLILLLQDKISTYITNPDMEVVARNALYLTGFVIARDHFPLGSGLGTFGGWISNLFYSPLYAQYHLDIIWGLGPLGDFIQDTFWPYILAQFGFAGVVLYAWILARMAGAALRVARCSLDPSVRAFALGTLIVLLEAAIESIASPVFMRAPFNAFLFAAMGITYRLGQRVPMDNACLCEGPDERAFPAFQDPRGRPL